MNEKEEKAKGVAVAYYGIWLMTFFIVAIGAYAHFYYGWVGYVFWWIAICMAAFNLWMKFKVKAILEKDEQE